MLFDVMQEAFHDELKKIAAADPLRMGHDVHQAMNQLIKKPKVLALISGAGAVSGASRAAMLDKKDRTKKNGKVVSRGKAALMGGAGGAVLAPAVWRAMGIPGDIKAHKAKNIAKVILEKAKHAGALQGHVRGGRRPLSATTLLDKEKEETKGTRKKLADLTKLSASPKGIGKNINTAKTLGLLGIGAYGLHKVQQAKRRHDIGYQVEQQQRQGGF